MYESQVGPVRFASRTCTVCQSSRGSWSTPSRGSRGAMALNKQGHAVSPVFPSPSFVPADRDFVVYSTTQSLHPSSAFAVFKPSCFLPLPYRHPRVVVSTLLPPNALLVAPGVDRMVFLTCPSLLFCQDKPALQLPSCLSRRQSDRDAHAEAKAVRRSLVARRCGKFEKFTRSSLLQACYLCPGAVKHLLDLATLHPFALR